VLQSLSLHFSTTGWLSWDRVSKALGICFACAYVIICYDAISLRKRLKGSYFKVKNDNHFILKAIKNGNLPPVLYKYRPLGERTEEIITKSSFWFAEPNSFNDPFDCNLSEVRNHKPKHLFRFLGSKYSLNGYNKAEIKSKLREEPEILDSWAMQARKSIFGKKAILSLSKVHDDILMWSHYSSSHSGIVIALDLTKDPDFFVRPIQVVYNSSNSYKPINSFIDYLDDREKFIYNMYSTKSEKWRYEEEVRIYKEKSGLYPIKSKAISKIYFGCKTKKEKRDNFIELCKSNNLDHIKFYHAVTAYDNFSLNFYEI